jgi:hypothetical protein
VPPSPSEPAGGRDRRLLPPPPAPGDPEEGRRRLTGHRAARHLRQLRHAQARRGQGTAGPQPEGHAALYAHELLLDQPDGVLLLRDHPPGHPPRLVHLSQRAHGSDRRFHRSLERPPASVRLD